MGVDSKLYIRPEVDIEDIITALKALGKENVEWKPTTVAPGYINIFFESKQKGWGRRMIHFHSNVGDSCFGMNCHLLSLRSNDEAHDVLKALASMFGGIFQANDYTDDCEMFEIPGAGDFRWTLEQYYASHPDPPQGSDKQVQHFLEWHKENYAK